MMTWNGPSWCEYYALIVSIFLIGGRAANADDPLLMGEVSKFAGGGERKSLGGRRLGEFDSVKEVSILIDVAKNGGERSGHGTVGGHWTKGRRGRCGKWDREFNLKSVFGITPPSGSTRTGATIPSRFYLGLCQGPGVGKLPT